MLLSSLCRQLTSACTIQSKSALKARHLRYHDGQIAAALTSGSTSSSASAISTSNIALGSRHATITTSSTSSIAGGDEPEIVQVLKLNMLKDNPGAVKKKRRIGRGIGSSKGKTSGRGHKGQKARSGGSIPLGFEGGQTKFYKLLPKRGFTNKRHKTEMVPINVGTIQDYIDMGRLNIYANDDNGDGDAQTLKVLTMKDFCVAGMCHPTSIKHGMKLLSKGKERLRTPIQLEISRASYDAITAIESVGGQVTTVHYNQLALRALLRPEKFLPPPSSSQRGENHADAASDTTAAASQQKKKSKKPLRKYPKFARPPPKLQPYYTNWEKNRGYLSVQAQMRNLLKKRPELEEIFESALSKEQSKIVIKEEE